MRHRLREVTTRGTQDKIARITSAFQTAWLTALDDFHAGVEASATAAQRDGALRTLIASWQSTIERSFNEAYQHGRGLWGRQQTSAESDSFKAAKAKQKAFATRFAMQEAQGEPGTGRRMGAGTRSGMYREAVAGAVQRGAVDGGPPGQLIYWRLSACRHCVVGGDARVTTRRGLVAIKDVVVGDEVLTHRCLYRRVTHTQRTEGCDAASRVVVEIRSPLGAVRVTGDHRVLTDTGWIESLTVANGGGRVLRTPHTEHLCESVGARSIPGPYADANGAGRSALGADSTALLDALCSSGDLPPMSRAKVVGELVPDADLYDLTVEEDHSFVVEGVDVSNCADCPTLSLNSPYTIETLPTVPRGGATTCRSRCRCFLTFRDSGGTRRQPQTPEDTATQQEEGRPLEQRVFGPPPEPPPGKRLATEGERGVLEDLEQRVNAATRRASQAHDSGDTKSRDRWLRDRKELQGRLRDFADERDIWHVRTLSTREVLNGADMSADDVRWMTHMRGIDGRTVHRAQAGAVREAADVAVRDLSKRLAALPAERGRVVPSLDTLARLADNPGAAFATGRFEALALVVEEETPDTAPSPAGEVTVSIVGLGVAATLRAAVEGVRELAETPRPILFGPVGEGWEDIASAAGLWATGPVEEVNAFVRALSGRVGGRGVVAARWQV